MASALSDRQKQVFAFAFQCLQNDPEEIDFDKFAAIAGFKTHDEAKAAYYELKVKIGNIGGKDFKTDAANDVGAGAVDTPGASSRGKKAATVNAEEPEADAKAVW